MTATTRFIDELGDILIELTDATGFDHTPEALFAYERAKEKLHHQLQKARHDWLREEIVTLKAIQKDFIARWEHPDSKFALEHPVKSETLYHLQTIIDRYHSELDQDI